MGIFTEGSTEIQHLCGITALLCTRIALKQLKKAHTRCYGTMSSHTETSAAARRN